VLGGLGRGRRGFFLLRILGREPRGLLFLLRLLGQLRGFLLLRVLRGEPRGFFLLLRVLGGLRRGSGLLLLRILRRELRGLFLLLLLGELRGLLLPRLLLGGQLRGLLLLRLLGLRGRLALGLLVDLRLRGRLRLDLRHRRRRLDGDRRLLGRAQGEVGRRRAGYDHPAQDAGNDERVAPLRRRRARRGRRGNGQVFCALGDARLPLGGERLGLHFLLPLAAGRDIRAGALLRIPG